MRLTDQMLNKTGISACNQVRTYASEFKKAKKGKEISYCHINSRQYDKIFEQVKRFCTKEKKPIPETLYVDDIQLIRH